MYLPSGRLEAKKSSSNFSKTYLIMGFKGSIAEGPLGLSSCWPFSSSRPSTVVEDLGKVSLGKSFPGVRHVYFPVKDWICAILMFRFQRSLMLRFCRLFS